MSRKEVSVPGEVGGLGATPQPALLSPVLSPRAPEAGTMVDRPEGAAMSLGAAPEPVPAWPLQGGDIYIREQRTVEEGGDPGECQQVGGAPCLPPCTLPSVPCAWLWHSSGRQERGEVMEVRRTGTPETETLPPGTPCLPILPYPYMALDTSQGE